MKKKFLVFLQLVFLIVIAGFAGAAGTIALSPSSVQGAVNGTVQVNVVAQNVSDATTGLYGYQFDVSYNGSVLRLNSITFSTLLGTFSGPQQQYCTSQSDWSTVQSGGTTTVSNIACTRIVTGGINNANGNLATIQFNVLASGSSPITINNVLVSNSSAQSIAITVNGTSNFSGCNTPPHCATNANCNDNNPATTDICLNAGTCSASCDHVANVPQCQQGVLITSQCQCGNTFPSTGYCCSGTHIAQLACATAADCNDNNTCTTDSCFTAGGVCATACVHTPIATCNIHTPRCGDTICEGAEDAIVCPADCGSGGTPGGGTGDSGGSGGNGGSGGDGDGGDGGTGGGGATGSEGYKALTRELDFGTLKVGSAAQPTIKISHGFPRLSAFKISLSIFKGDELVFFEEESTGLLDPTRTHIIDFNKSWTPSEEGTYNATVVLSNADKTLNFDIHEYAIMVGATGSDSIIDDILGGGNDSGGSDNDVEITGGEEDNVIPSEEEGLNIELIALILLVLLIIVGAGFVLSKGKLLKKSEGNGKGTRKS